MRPSQKHMRAIAGRAALICVTVACASTARAQTLQQELSNAYASNPQIRGSRAQLEATAEDVPQALSGWRPTVTITASGGPVQLDSFTRSTARNVVGTNYFHTQLYQAAITQPLYSGGQTVARTAQADHLFAAAQWQLVSIEQTVLSAVATALPAAALSIAALFGTVSLTSSPRRPTHCPRSRFIVCRLRPISYSPHRVKDPVFPCRIRLR